MPCVNTGKRVGVQDFWWLVPKYYTPTFYLCTTSVWQNPDKTSVKLNRGSDWCDHCLLPFTWCQDAFCGFVLVCMILLRCFIYLFIYFPPVQFPHRHLSKCVKSEPQRGLRGWKSQGRAGSEALLIFFPPLVFRKKIHLPCQLLLPWICNAQENSSSSLSRGLTQILSVI